MNRRRLGLHDRRDLESIYHLLSRTREASRTCSMSLKHTGRRAEVISDVLAKRVQVHPYADISRTLFATTYSVLRVAALVRHRSRCASVVTGIKPACKNAPILRWTATRTSGIGSCEIATGPFANQPPLSQQSSTQHASQSARQPLVLVSIPARGITGYI